MTHAYGITAGENFRERLAQLIVEFEATAPDDLAAARFKDRLGELVAGGDAMEIVAILSPVVIRDGSGSGTGHPPPPPPPRPPGSGSGSGSGGPPPPPPDMDPNPF